MSFIQEANEIINDIKEDSYLKELWEIYLKDNPYIKELNFFDTVEVVKIIAEKVEIKEIENIISPSPYPYNKTYINFPSLRYCKVYYDIQYWQSC